MFQSKINTDLFLGVKNAYTTHVYALTLMKANIKKTKLKCFDF